MEVKFKYRCDKRCKWLTVVYIVVITLGFASIIIFGKGGYAEAWLLSVLIAMLLLYVLSIPRYIKVDDENLEIQCIVEMTRIDIRDITEIHKVEPRAYRHRLFCLLGSYGFFGYYGYYFNFRTWEIMKVYAGERDYLVEIEDKYEQKYLVSCRDADRFIDAVMKAKLENISGPK